jgi:hypothetical protein
VNRRIDLEQAFAAVRGSVPPDLTASENQARLKNLQLSVTERLVEERLIMTRAAMDGITVSDAEFDAEVAHVADEIQLDPDRLAAELATRGSDVDELRTSHRAAMTIGRFVTERVFTSQNPEELDDYDAWLVEAERNADANVLLAE